MGFKGDFFALHSDETPALADAYKFDLRFCKDTKNIVAVAEQARNLRISIVAEGIENMEQMSVLRKMESQRGRDSISQSPFRLKNLKN